MKKIYFGGTILTMDPDNLQAEAVLTENGKIMALGTLQELKSSDAVTVDLKGKTLIPGFVDGHSHLISMGLNLTQYCDLGGCQSHDEILERIQKFIRERDLTPGQSITCKGYDTAILKEGSHPTAALLDKLGKDYPIACIHLSGHVAAYNSVAMEKAGVCDATYVCSDGGFAGYDENGKLNGYFEETAMAAFASIFAPDLSYDKIKQAVIAAQDNYVKNGYTTIQDGSCNSLVRLEMLQSLASEIDFKTDVVAYMDSKLSAVPTWEKMLERNGRDYRNRLKIGGVKMILDGSPQVRTAWLRKPYQNETEYKGYPILTDKEVKNRLCRAAEYGLQPLAHCNGDAACEQFLSAWQEVYDASGSLLRPVMIHAQTVGYDQLERMSKVGMMASFFVGHCYYWGDTHLKNIGERAVNISPVKYAKECGVAFNLHQDSPVTKPDMLHSIWCAVNRISRNGICIGRQNRITPIEALMAATSGGAYGYFEEDRKGVIKAGALADFVILDKDPTAINAMDICNVQVLETIKEDKSVYCKDSKNK